MKTFYFSPKDACTGKICNSKGKCCVLGQFALQFGKFTKSELKRNDYNAYKFCYTHIGSIESNEMYEVNDNNELSWNQKIKSFRNILKFSNYRIVVRKADIV